MTNSNGSAGFLVRFIASWLDANIVFIPIALLLIPVASAQTLPDLGASLAICLTAILTWLIIGIFYSAATTYWWGGTPGKLLTGLRVVSEDGKPLTFKRLLFRHTIGYQLSGLLLGLGFGAVIKDVNKQGWHDKTVGSKVIVVKSLWPLALSLLIVLFAFNAITTLSTVSKFMTSDLYKNEIVPAFEEKGTTFTPPSTQPRESLGFSASVPTNWVKQETTDTLVITPSKLSDEDLKLSNWASNQDGLVVIRESITRELLKNGDGGHMSAKELLEELRSENKGMIPGYPTYKNLPKRNLPTGTIEVNPSTPPLTTVYGPGALEEQYWLTVKGNLYEIFVYFPHDKAMHATFEQNLSAILGSLEIK